MPHLAWSTRWTAFLVGARAVICSRSLACSRSHRALAPVLAAALVALIAPSCVTIYDLDGFDSAVSMLCASVAECDPAFYPECVAQAGGRLAAASADERAQFLVAFTDTGCLETCTAAKSCFDLKPLCANTTSACTVQAQCCGFWKADAQCEASSCCQPDGVACANDVDCCDGACLDFGDGKTCGGVECVELDGTCGGGISCCGELRCSLESERCVRCEAFGGPCVSGADCCSNYCNNAETGADLGACSNPTCGLLREQVCNDADECCDDFCVTVARDGLSVCNNDDCIPNGFGCDSGANCCSGSCRNQKCADPPGCSIYFGDDCSNSAQCCEGTCDAVSSSCCLLDGVACTSDQQCCGASTCEVSENGTTTCQGPVPCGKHLDACSGDDACCAQRCNTTDGYCCKAVDDVCSHGVCQETGDPLSPECSNLEDGDATVPPGMSVKELWGLPGCIEAICKKRGFEKCCCDAWDKTCRDMAMSTSECGVTCPAQPM